MSSLRYLLILFLVAASGSAQHAATSTAKQLTGFPFQNETLHYSINWPSGLSLGDVTISANRGGQGWDFEATLNAGVPAFPTSDRFHSKANADLCSEQLDRNIAQGNKKASEKTTFDYKTLRGERVTLNGGGKSEFSIPSCARDALTFLYFARRELGQGRVPPADQVYFGPEYSVHMEYTGTETIQVAEKKEVTDRMSVSFKGPASNATFEILFARDPARTPLLVRIPLSIGSISMELVR
jgi:hypothetical protein